jgi:hypothetical protein
VPFQGLSRIISAVGVDSATPWLIILYILASIAVIAYELSTSDQSASLICTVRITNFITLFAIVAPLVLAGIAITSKLMRFPLQDAAYLRSCGISATPAIMVMTASLFENPVLKIILIAVALPLVFYVLKYSFGLDLGRAFVAFVLAAIFYVIGQLISFALIFAVMLGAGMQKAKGKQQASLNQNSSSSSSYTSPSYSSNASPAPTGPPVDYEARRIESWRDSLTTLLNRKNDGTSREQMAREVASIKANVKAAESTLAEKPGYADLGALIKQCEEKALTLTSEKPPDNLFVEPVATSTLAADKSDGDAEISFQNVRVRPPAGTKLDLTQATPDPKSLTCTSTKEWGTSFTIRTVPATVAKQRRPWVATDRVATN